MNFAFFFFFLAELGLYCCKWAFSSCGKWGCSLVVVLGVLIVVAPLLGEHGFKGAQAQ